MHLGCAPDCGCGATSRGARGLGDPIMTLEGLGITSAEMKAQTAPRDPTIWGGTLLTLTQAAPEPTFWGGSLLTMTQAAPAPSPGGSFAPTTAPAPSTPPPPGGAFLPGELAPTDGPLPLPPPPPQPDQAIQTSQQTEEQAAADRKAIKIAIGVGGAFVAAAIFLRGR